MYLFNYIWCTLWLCQNSDLEAMAHRNSGFVPILKVVIFQFAMLNYQRVYVYKCKCIYTCNVQYVSINSYTHIHTCISILLMVWILTIFHHMQPYPNISVMSRYYPWCHLDFLISIVEMLCPNKYLHLNINSQKSREKNVTLS